MIKIEHIVTASPEQMDFIIEGMRNPLESWAKSDSGYLEDVGFDPDDYNGFMLGKNDRNLMQRLCKAGTDHRKYMRMMPIYMRITAPLYWWKEFDTYKVGTVTNSCSTMHKIHDKEFTLDDFSHEHLICNGAATRYEKGKDIHDQPEWEFSYDSPGLLQLIIENLNYYRNHCHHGKMYWWQLIQLLPSSYNQTRNVMISYEAANNMYHARKNHKLDEWRIFCDGLKKLPCSELITMEFEKDKE